VLAELHAGCMLTFLSWLHLGFDLTVPAFISSSGFKVESGRRVTDSFITVNPGVRIRIALGNIG
jgi:hypothetical protein